MSASPPKDDEEGLHYKFVGGMTAAGTLGVELTFTVASGQTVITLSVDNALKMAANLKLCAETASRMVPVPYPPRSH